MAAVLQQQLQSVLWLWMGVALVLAVLSGVLRSRAFKGWCGERRVRRWLRQGLDRQHYHDLHNITLQLEDGRTTQIDHVVVSRWGLFVLETKNFQGWIIGSEKQPTWNQSIYRHRSSFPNPLHQNWRHIKALQEILALPLSHLHSVIVFAGDSSFKTPMPARVTQGRECVAYIRSFDTVLWSDEEVRNVLSMLQSRRLKASLATHQKHVTSLRQRHSGQAPAVIRERKQAYFSVAAPSPPADETLIPPALAPAQLVSRLAQLPEVQKKPCPECGDDLVRRSLAGEHGRNHYFLRCARFPHCRFLQTQEATTPEASSLKKERKVEVK